MKFKKILFIYFFFYICFTVNSFKLNLRSGTALQNSNNSIDFKDSTNNIKPSNVSVLEDVIQAKPTSIISKSNENTRFKEKESIERMENNMESPVIIKSNPKDSTFQDISQRVAMDTPQTITNSQAFDVVYKDHKDYYNDKKFVIFDKNFKQMEGYLLGQFANMIDSNLVYDEKLVHVDDLKKKKNLNVNLQNVPRITKEQVENSLKSKEYGFGQNETKVYVSDPYNEIFPNDRK